MTTDNQLELLRALGSRVRQRREELGFSRQVLADRAGVHLNYVGGIERGERNVAIINLARLGRALGYQDLGEFLAGLSL